MSKGAKGEKSLKKIINKEKLAEEEKHNYEGSLEINKHVKSFFNGKDEICKILECRVLKEHENDKKRNEYSYEYYVHFINYNRRNDSWITRDKITLDDEAIEIELKRREQKEKEHIHGTGNLFENDEHEGLEKSSLIAHEEATKVKTIDQIQMGKYKCNTWYFSPYPEGYHVKTLLICEFCFNFYVDQSELNRHSAKCPLKHPPGNEIYRDGTISMFEVDGKVEQFYCENLCYLAKLFLDHKTLQWDVEPFLFYILCEYDQFGYHFVGYFSKEKESSQGYNVACILTMPFHQRKGYGKFLIDFSYLLSKKEQKVATPERPLSDLGFSTYFSYWTQKLCEVLKTCNDNTITINKLAELTSIKHSDILKVLGDLELLRYHDGQHIIISDKAILDQLFKKAGRPGHPLHPEKLLWTPYKFRYEF